MKRFIRKTTSVFMSIAMVALIGAPAYATVAEDEDIFASRPETIESGLPDIASEKANVAVDFVKEPAEDTKVPSVCDHSDEEPEILEEPETEPEIEQETEETEPEDNEEDTVPEEPTIGEDEILDYIDSEEFQDALEDAGVDSEVIEGEIEDGNYEIIYITQEDFEQMRREHALSQMTYGVTLLGEGLMVLLMIPAVPFLFFIPFAGPFMVGGIIASPVIVLGALGYTIASPIIAIIEYKNYELEPGYEIID